jgi:GT2 family glycosyltransferase
MAPASWGSRRRRDRRPWMLERLRGPRPAPAAAEQSTESGIEHAAWLSQDLLLLVHGSDGVGGETPDIYVQTDERSFAVESRSLSYVASDSDVSTGRHQNLVAIFLPGSDPDLDSPWTLLVRAPEGELELASADLERSSTDLPTLARKGLAALDPDTRTRILEFLAAISFERPPTSGVRMSNKLFDFRETLRERLPRCVVSADEPQGLGVDSMLLIDESCFYVNGWMRDGEAEIVRLTAVSPEGARAELRSSLFRYARPDIAEIYAGSRDDPREKYGYHCFFELGLPSLLSNGWLLEMENAEGAAVEVEAPPLVRNPTAVRDAVLSDLNHERPERDELMSDHVFPAVSRVQQRMAAAARVESVVQYGNPPSWPQVSIIAVLSGPIDLIEHQLAQFAHDPEIRDADLIYVLDSPELADQLTDFAGQLSPIYPLPFRTVILDGKAGLSAATNLGASLARGRLLLLLNPDVLPDRPGWVGTMSQFYESQAGIGALGPKLLFEDDSLQSAGLHFRRRPGSAFWERVYHYRGLHRTIPTANVSHRVPALSGACLMVANDLYQTLEGLAPVYIQGGEFEVPDLCLRLTDAGHENWYLSTVELYDLQLQSHTPSSPKLAARYNNWVQTHLWDAEIERATGQEVQGTAQGSALR